MGIFENATFLRVLLFHHAEMGDCGMGIFENATFLRVLLSIVAIGQRCVLVGL
jgi:hypothetical protein